MQKCAIRLPLENWREWILPIQETTRLLNVECPVEFLLHQPEGCEVLQKAGISCLVVKDIIQPELSEYLALSHPTTDELLQTRQKVFDTLLNAESLHANCFPLQLNLDSLSEANLNQQLYKYASHLKELLKAPLEAQYSIAIQVRIPQSFPSSKEFERARKLCTLAGNTRIGLYVHFDSDEFASSGGDIRTFVQENAPYLKAIAFHYDAHLGDTLFDDEQLAWAQSLAEFKKDDMMIVFAPTQSQNTNYSALCQTMLSWADFYK